MPTDQIAPSWVWVMLGGMSMAIAALVYALKTMFTKYEGSQERNNALALQNLEALKNNTAALNALLVRLQEEK
jgi:hypothetical protein